MAHDAPATALGPLQQVAGDFAADKQAFSVPWGKAMMWIFLLSDTFIFSCFLTSYMNVRISTMSAWPNPSQVFALHLLGGLWVWGRTTAKVLRGTEVGKVRLSVELCTVYWHYLLLVWVVLFAVLLHTHT